jgi:polyhydroxyalkanoate synthesis regulator phasin
MTDFGNLVQKAFYLGVGAASIAAEKAGSTIHELKEQAQSVADEMVQRGEMNAEEAKKFVNDMVKQAQDKIPTMPKPQSEPTTDEAKEPRRIEILDDEESEASATDAKLNEAAELRKQLEELQQELKNLKQE